MEEGGERGTNGRRRGRGGDKGSGMKDEGGKKGCEEVTTRKDDGRERR